MENNSKRKVMRKKVYWTLLASGPLFAIIAELLRRLPDDASRLYAEGPGTTIPWLLAKVSGALPFSLAEWLLAIALGRWLWLLISSLKQAEKFQAFGLSIARVVMELSVVAAIFYLSWGFHYSRSPLEERLGFSSVSSAIDSLTLATSAEEFVHETNALYLQLHGSEDAGDETSIDDREALLKSIDEGWLSLSGYSGFSKATQLHYGKPKPLLISPLLHRLGLSGFYFPFSAEANYNKNIPAISLPRVLAHEMAHQRGIAPEDEANFTGWLVAASSPSIMANYSAALFAQRQCLRALLKQDLEEGKRLLALRYAGVQRDIDAHAAYWNRNRGMGRTLSRRVNHAYLQSNKVKGGFDSYSQSLQLILLWKNTREARP